MSHLHTRRTRFLVLRDSIPLYSCPDCRWFSFGCTGCVNHTLRQKMIEWRIRTFGWHDATNWLQRKYH